MSKEVAQKVVIESTFNVLAVIEKAVINPDVDVGKMQQLLDMQLKILDREAKQHYIRDFASMQAEFPSIKKRGRTQQSTYATFDDINDGVAPARGKYGFALSFVPETSEGFMKITAILSHHAGHTETSAITLPFDTSGNKNAVQAQGSAIRYGMRYSIVALLSISTHDGDDNDADGLHEKVSEKEAKTMEAVCLDYELNELKIFTYYTQVFNRPVSNWSEFPAGSYKKVMKELEKQGEAKAKKSKAKK